MLVKRTGFSYDTELVFKDGKKDMFDLMVREALSLPPFNTPAALS